MSYEYLMYFHLLTVVPCIFLGGFLLLARKGGEVHRKLGMVYMSLMMITAFIAMFIQAQLGPMLFNHFGYIHLFCLLVFWTVPTALIAIKKRKIKTHQRKMILLYVGAIILAGGFTLMPGRYLHHLFFGA
ncbi:DUF2306 domain-containing protein [Algoriphagus antarcticus]|uniref:Putative membrane protein n=1 Tax=Algoriphagus antarcticus TaxID=238540 RepID=A0A3E0DU12_9BACT|nr:DUF2306 domain-containing protein [Algoriphagus antarcticus]REG86398.1 putative membrane protein [Algoriphagus antarcticus]